MANIIPNTTQVADRDNERSLLMKILHRLNLSASATPATPSANVAVTNTPLAIDFDGTQPVTVENQPHVLVDNMPVVQPVSGTVNIGNLPGIQPVSGTVAVSNFPATQPVSGTVGVTGLDFTNDGHLNTMSVPFEFEVAHDGFYRESGVNKSAFIYRSLGRRVGFNSTGTLQDIGLWLGTSINLLPELTGVENLELVSSSVQDDATPGGTGAWTVRIHYLSTSYVLTFVDYALNGTTAVSVAEKMLFIYCMEVLTGGTSEVSEGDIDLRIAGGGAIHERIGAGSNRSYTDRFMVPDNYKAYIVGWYACAIGTTCDCRLRSTTRMFDNTLNSKYVVKSTAYLAAGTNVERKLVYNKLPARAKSKISLFPGATPAGNRVDVEAIYLLVQD